MNFKQGCVWLAKKFTDVTGSWWAGLAATALVTVWIIGGFFVGFTDTYQIIINTLTTIVTFIMVFFIQHTQNRESKATQIKLDELILKVKRADNSLINSETLSEEELCELQEKYKALAEKARIKIGQKHNCNSENQ